VYVSEATRAYSIPLIISVLVLLHFEITFMLVFINGLKSLFLIFVNRNNISIDSHTAQTVYIGNTSVSSTHVKQLPPRYHVPCCIAPRQSFIHTRDLHASFPTVREHGAWKTRRTLRQEEEVTKDSGGPPDRRTG